MEAWIGVEMKGGLGNQLFQYAAGRAILKANPDAKLFLFSEQENKHNRDGFDYRKELNLKGEYLGFSTVNLPHIPNARLYSQGSSFEPWFVERWTPPIVLRGYFQFLPAIEAVLKEICNELKEALRERRIRMIKKYGELNEGIFMHVRRGDYLNLPNFHYIQNENYYKQALNRYRSKGEKETRVFIISDDIEWCKQSSFFKGLEKNVFVDENELDTLALMTECDGGAIIGNSTFSWWGAMLGAESKKMPVIYPSRWIAERIHTLFPEHWICI